MNADVGPRFLTQEEVFAIHAIQVLNFGGAGELRDLGLLDSSINAVRASFGGEFLYRDIFEMAASYAVSIVGNHPFVAGNKRTGAMCAAVFLDINGYDFDADDVAFTQAILDIACGRAGVTELAVFFRENSRRR